MIDQNANRLEPIMPFPVCPHCGTTQTLDLRTYGHYKGPITCFACKGRYEVEFSGEMIQEFGDRWRRNLGEPGGVMISPPKPIGDASLLDGITSPPVPKAIHRDYLDACTSLASGIPKGAALLARHAIQHALLSKGIPDQKPDEMVNIARAKGIISEIAIRQCKASVFMGGKAAHPQSDPLDSIGEKDARQSLFATRRVLLELFNPSGVPDV